ncbi:MAG: hypothetical protein A2W19_01165 [Spirochaetes bacterium RBG_16_49_21]|nr:MAG: hypothetical protein A2W19_01165 [Spirochaetes bacterium RBG_16_49_21]
MKNQKLTIVAYLMLFFIIASATGCCCSVRTSPTGETERLLDRKKDAADELTVKRLGIGRLNSTDMHLAKLYGHFVRSVEDKYKGRIVRNYDPKTGGNVDKYVIFDMDPEYLYNRGKSVAVSWPGVIVLAPMWWGLVYTLEVKTTMRVYRAGEILEEEYRFKDAFTVRHISAGRLVWIYTLGWHPLFGCVGGVFSGWDDDFKECVVNKIIEKNYFAETYRQRLLNGLKGGLETARGGF